jgi:hypothetical protein
MSEFEDDDIDKMFEDMMSSDDIGVDLPRIDAIISIEQVSLESMMKELVFISQSLSQSLVHINELLLNYISFDDYDIDSTLKDILGNMYKLSEDLDDHIIEIMIEDSQFNDEEEDDE